jgi:hypothetical protein
VSLYPQSRLAIRRWYQQRNGNTLGYALASLSDEPKSFASHVRKTALQGCDSPSLQEGSALVVGRWNSIDPPRLYNCYPRREHLGLEARSCTTLSIRCWEWVASWKLAFYSNLFETHVDMLTYSWDERAPDWSAIGCCFLTSFPQ